MQTWPWFCYQSGLAPRIWSYYHLKDSLVNAEAFLTCPQPSFYFLSSNPEVDVLGSSNSEQNLESICLCVLNSLCFPVSADFVCVVYIFVCCVYICVCCVYICVLCIYLCVLCIYLCVLCIYLSHIVLYQCNSCSYPWHVFQDHYKPLWCVFPHSKISIKGTRC